MTQAFDYKAPASLRRHDAIPTEVQTIIFDKKKFSLSEAKAWLKKNDFKAGDVDETEESYRFRQNDPGSFKEGSFRTIDLGPGISAVIGKKKGEEASRRRRASMAFEEPYVERTEPGKAPTAFRIWKAGDNWTDHGAKESEADTLFTRRSAELLMDAQQKRGNLYSIDVDHLSLSDTAPPEARRAVGWHRLEVRETEEGPELWAVDVEWTQLARRALEADPPEWRYFSPAYDVSRDTREVLAYINTSITLNPATWNNTRLASTRRTTAMDMEEVKRALEKMAEGDDDDAKKAKRALAALDVPPSDEKKDEDDGDDEADEESDDDKPGDKDEDETKRKRRSADAADEDEKKDDEADDEADDETDTEDKRASVRSAKEVESIAREATHAALASWKEQQQKAAETQERDRMIASMTDLTPAQRKFAGSLPLAQVKEMFSAFRAESLSRFAAAQNVAVTRGQSDGAQGERVRMLPREERAELDSQMGLGPVAPLMERKGTMLIFNHGTPEQARQLLASIRTERMKANVSEAEATMRVLSSMGGGR